MKSTTALSRTATVALLALIVLSAAGCADMRTVVPGVTQDSVRASHGAPALQVKTTSGERWAYSTAPEGKLTWLLDFDASGRLVSRVQGLTPARIAQVGNGQTQGDVEALIGPSYWSLRYPFKQEELVHIYRFDDLQLPMCFYVGYNASGTVTSTGSQEEVRSRFRLGRVC